MHEHYLLHSDVKWKGPCWHKVNQEKNDNYMRVGRPVAIHRVWISCRCGGGVCTAQTRETVRLGNRRDAGAPASINNIKATAPASSPLIGKEIKGVA